ncbi:MAG: peptidase M20, partial [Rhizorhabdus sp.]
MNPLLLAFAASAAVAQPATISPERLSSDVRTLASPAFEGRAPGTAGETKTIDWLIAQLKAIGLQPAAKDGGWTQPVPLVRTQIGAGTMAVATGGAAVPLVQGRDIYV